MAATNMKAVKLRIKSVQNTMQITKAMQLVAASKLRKANCPWKYRFPISVYEAGGQQ